jgi:hypothetical protein
MTAMLLGEASKCNREAGKQQRGSAATTIPKAARAEQATTASRVVAGFR